MQCSSSKKDIPVELDKYGNIISNNSEKEEPMYILNPKANINVIWDETNEDFKNIIYKINSYGHAMIIMDSCEWIYFKIEGYPPTISHSYNCKFCKERNNK